MDNSELPCADKLVFETKKEAIGAAVTAKYRRGIKLKPYICRFCNLWHMASDYDDSDRP